MRVRTTIVAMLVTGCATFAGLERPATLVPGATVEEVEASAVAVLEESGLRARVGDDGAIVASTEGSILPRGAKAFATCPSGPYERIGPLRWSSATGYGVSGTFEVRVRPANSGGELTVLAELTVPECPDSRKGELRRLCSPVSCSATPALERRIVERLEAGPQPDPFVSLTRAVSAGTTSNRSPTMP